MIGVCSTHMPANDTRIEVSIDVLAQQLKRWRKKIINNKKDPMVLLVLGDFNFNPSSYLYTHIIKHYGFFDARSSSEEEGKNVFINDINVTTNDWYKSYNQILDYIWIFNEDISTNRSTFSSQVKINSLRHISVYAELSL